MIVLITGASHTGKTALAQRLLVKYGYPYLSLDHLKMGMIRSGRTELTPESGTAQMTEFLWPVVREMIKTAIENRQNMIVEGCYIPFDWAKDFGREYIDSIRYCCLVMSERYIRNHFDDIRRHAEIVEDRGGDEGCTLEGLVADNARFLEMVRECGAEHVLIDDSYDVNIEI